MLRKGMTIRDAAHEWTREMNAIDRGMIEILMNSDPDSWSEVTVVAEGNRVYCYDYNECGEIDRCDGEEDRYEITLDRGEIVKLDSGKFDVIRDDILPMWGTMWSFGDSLDDEWLEDHGGLRIMSECGFRIYHHDEWGYFFGIDGAGYDFYEDHWIPLYKKRGLRWHDENAEE